jgi:hypothetical protein
MPLSTLRGYPRIGGVIGYGPTRGSGIWTLQERYALEDDFYDDVSLLLHMNGSNGSTTFLDSSRLGHTVTANGNAQISTAQGKFGGASAAFDGNGDYLSVAGSSSAFSSTGDLTIEAWCYIRSASAFAGIFSLRESAAAAGAAINILNNGNFDFGIYGSGGGSFATYPVSLNEWLHVALVRSGSGTNNCTCFVNGTLVGQFTSTAEANRASNTAVIGRYYANGTNQYFVDGYIDDVRYTKGRARYEAAFTPRQRAFIP